MSSRNKTSTKPQPTSISSSSSTTLPQPTPALLLLDLPVRSLAGIDLLSFTASPRFRGVRQIPTSGRPHFAFVSGSQHAFPSSSSDDPVVVSGDGGGGGRCGVWFYNSSEPGAGEEGMDLTVLKWDSGSETLVPETQAAALMGWRANLGRMWMEGLTPYRPTGKPKPSGRGKKWGADGGVEQEGQAFEEENDVWATLTSHITPAVLDRILPDSHTSVPAFGQHTWRLSSMSASASEIQDIAGLEQTAAPTPHRSEMNLHDPSDPTLHFLPIDLRQTWAPGVTGRERTTAARDRSWALTDLVRRKASSDPAQVLGELQFAFVMLPTLSNVSCAEQWLRLLRLLLTCVGAVVESPEFFVEVLRTLKGQLEFCLDADGEVLAFLDLVDENSELKRLLSRFRKGIEGLPREDEEGAVKEVLEELEELEDFLAESRGWAFGGNFVRHGTMMLEDGEEVDLETTAFDEEEEEGEFAPTIVDLTEEQARELGIERGMGAFPRRKGRSKLEQDVLDGLDGSDEEGERENDDQRDDDEEMGDLDELDSRF